MQDYASRSRIRNIFNSLNKIFKQSHMKLNKFKLLDFSAFFIALIILLPILNFFKEAIVIVYKGEFNLGLTGKSEIIGTIKILLFTSLISGTLGIINGWLLSNCDFKFRKFLRICQLIPLAAPAYLITAILQDLASILGYQLTGIGWGTIILSISTYPYVFILTNESFNKFGVNQINASRSLGVGPWKSFFRIALPMALPALATGISLSCMEVMNN